MTDRETHIDPDKGLWIPQDLRTFDRQIVFRTPRSTIQHYGSEDLDPYYGLVDESHFGEEYDTDLAPDRVSIKPEGEEPVTLVVDVDAAAMADGGTAFALEDLHSLPWSAIEGAHVVVEQECREDVLSLAHGEPQDTWIEEREGTIVGRGEGEGLTYDGSGGYRPKHIGPAIYLSTPEDTVLEVRADNPENALLAFEPFATDGGETLSEDADHPDCPKCRSNVFVGKQNGEWYCYYHERTFEAGSLPEGNEETLAKKLDAMHADDLGGGEDGE